MNQTQHRNPLDALIWWVASRFGTKAKEVDRFLKFAIVGTIGAVVDFAVLNILQHSVLAPSPPGANAKVALATGIAFSTAVLSNYLWNRYWTFPDSRAHSARRQLFQFFVVSVVGLVFRLFFVGATFGFFGNLGASLLSGELDVTATNQLGSNIAQAISIGIVMFWNFFANRYWTFNDVE
ncbi:MAG: GtrA family protein [Anaerolineae bacterium]|nr:GtrA family protein [Anaerolineae bacterium]